MTEMKEIKDIDEIPADEVQKGVFIVKEPFLVDRVMWSNHNIGRGVIYTGRFDAVIYGFTKDRRYNRDLRNYARQNYKGMNYSVCADLRGTLGGIF